MSKPLAVIFFRRNWCRDDWDYRFPAEELEPFFANLRQDLEKYDIQLQVQQAEHEITIRGYTDLLNSVRLHFPSAGLGQLCLGHVIGKSANLNLLEDLRRGINRIAFAPETIEPEGSDKVVCHNCGCGC